MELSDEGRLAELSAFLKPLLPAPAFAFNWLAIRRRFPASAGPRLFVDAWPRPKLIYTAVGEPLSSPRLDLTSFWEARRSSDAELGAFLRRLVGQGQLGRRTVVNCAFCPGLTEALRRLAPTVHRRVEDVSDCMGLYVSLASAAFYEKAAGASVPDGFRGSALREDEAALVTRTWSSQYIQDEEVWRDRIRFFPSRAFREEGSGALATFALFSPAGFSTHGYTLPPFRGRHLIRHGMLFNAQDSADLGVYPLAFVKPSNTTSQHTMRSASIFVETEHRMDLFSILPDPPSSKL